MLKLCGSIKYGEVQEAHANRASKEKNNKYNGACQKANI